MRPFTVFTAVLLSSSMLAAATETRSQSPVCQQLAQRVEQCQRGTARLSNVRASCDRIEEGFRAACGPLATIGASPSVGGVLDLLRQDFSVVPIEKTAAGVFPSHLVIGPADLAAPRVIALLRQAYRVGKTVAIAGAAQDDARRFHRLLRPGEETNCRPAKGQAKIELYGLQRSRYRTPPQNSSYCLLNLDQQSDASDRRWLRERFGSTPPQPAVGKVATTDDSTQYLDKVATGTHCSVKGSQSLGNLQLDLYTYGMRDFTDAGCSECKDLGADYYLVQEFASMTANSKDLGLEVFTPNPPDDQAGPFRPGLLTLEAADPQTTTTYESSYSNTQSTTKTASVGLDSDGPNVTAGGQMTTSKQTTYMVPATTILNESNLKSATTQWNFTPQSLPVGVDFDVATSWVWFVPQDAYPSGGTGNGAISIEYSAAFLSGSVITGDPIFSICSVPFPFSAWTVNPPQLSSLNPASTEINGGQFTITGQYLYPGSVVAVLIGGTAVPLTTNVDLVDENTIIVTVPGGYRTGNYQVQVNTQFNDQVTFSNTLDLTLTN